MLESEQKSEVISKGKKVKEGSDAMYNARKVVYFANELFKHIENDYKQ